MTITTTGSIEGRQITGYLGVVAGEAILGVNIFKDITAGFRNIVGGRSGKYEEELRKARATALEEMGQFATEMGADAIVGAKIDYETVGGQMLMVTASGTAVKLT
ncbi:MAG TPA: heavy metal-binding domain-containing protein [Tepidiformaceae bacterium]|nr:heavy metal-binding domain-containing protein [Tepidiformaceae bacterium]